MLAKILAIPLIAMIAIGCSAAPVAPSDPICPVNYNVVVNGPSKKEYKFTFQTDTRPKKGNDGYWGFTPVNQQEWERQFESPNEEIRSLNSELEKLFWSGGFIAFPKQESLKAPEWLSSRSWSKATSCPAPDSGRLTFSFRESVGDSYKTSIRVSEKTTYVVVSTLNGSSVSYSFPSAWIRQAYEHAFNGGPELNMVGEFTTPVVQSTESQDYTRSLLESLVGAEKIGRMAVAINLKAEDFEGHNELKPVIDKALQVSAAQEEKPVVAIIHAMLSTGQVGVASIAESGRFGFGGGFVLATGGIAGGGSWVAAGNYSSWFESKVDASIYIYPAPPTP